MAILTDAPTLTRTSTLTIRTVLIQMALRLLRQMGDLRLHLQMIADLLHTMADLLHHLLRGRIIKSTLKTRS